MLLTGLVDVGGSTSGLRVLHTALPERREALNAWVEEFQRYVWLLLALGAQVQDFCMTCGSCWHVGLNFGTSGLPAARQPLWLNASCRTS